MSDWLIEAARRPLDPGLPDGLRMNEGVIEFECRSCGRWSEYPADIEDFDIDNPNNLCGGSPRSPKRRAGDDQD